MKGGEPMTVFKEKPSEDLKKQLEKHQKIVVDYLRSLPSIAIFCENYNELSRSRIRMIMTKPESFFSLSVTNMVNLCNHIEKIKNN